jgi:hypothetical protein
LFLFPRQSVFEDFIGLHYDLIRKLRQGDFVIAHSFIIYRVFFTIFPSKDIVPMITSRIHDKYLLKIVFLSLDATQSGARKINKWLKRDKKNKPAQKEV